MAPTAYERSIAKRDVLENNLMRIKCKVQNHNHTPLTYAAADRYETQAEQNLTDLGVVHAEILSLNPGDEIDANNKTYHTLCDIADSLCNSLHGIKASLQTQSSTPTTSSSSSSALTKLPKLDLKSFDGNLVEWISFRDMFESSIHQSSSIPKIQKLVYLKSLLQGEAARLVQSIVLSDANYDTAWKLLNERYQNDREILFSVLRKLFSQNPSCSSANSIRQLVDTTKECIRSMEILNLVPDKATEAIILYVIIQKLDQASREIWEQNLKGTTVPPLKDLFEFLEQRARALAASMPIQVPKSKPQREESNKRVQSFHGQSNSKCKCCQGDFHPFYKCSKFLSLGISARYDLLKKNNCCFNCLNENHSSKSCSNLHRCRQCNQKHHSLLHKESNSQAQSNDEVKSCPASISSHHSSNDSSPTQGLLVTAITQVEGKNGHHQLCRAFLDSGSTASFVTQSCVNRLGLKQRKSLVEVFGLAATSVGTASSIVSLHFQPYFDKTVNFHVEALVIPKLTHNIPDSAVISKEYSYLKHVKLADPSWHQPAPVDILLGSDIFWTLVGTQRLTGPKGSPVAIDSKLGWLISGNLKPKTNTKQVEVHFSSQNSLDKQLEKFWEIESLPTTKILTPSERECENLFQETVTRDSEGKFTVALPFKANQPDVGQSYSIAVRRLRSLERRLAENPEHQKEYTKFMREYEELNHMTKVTKTYRDCSSNLPVLIPHHFVLKQESTTTKFRVVFDASAKSSNGKSLNDSLLVGPTLQDNLTDIIHRFRIHPIAFIADIAKMYRQILVRQDHRVYQHILWRESPKDEIEEYELNTVTYGTASAPYLAVKCLQNLAETNRDTYPIASAVVVKDFYVDDLMHSSSSLPNAIELQRELNALCSEGDFQLRKWSSNSKEFLQSVPESLREKSVFFDFGVNPSIKTLGIRWNTTRDLFQFQFQDELLAEANTKRAILSSIAKLYDPLGWLAPVVIRAKIMMQTLWKLQLDWDEELPEDVANHWLEIQSDFQNMKLIEINRCMMPFQPTYLELAGFSDASEKAYSACVYLCVYSKDRTQTSLVAAKTRVAPVKTISLPKLELCGAVLLVNLIETVSTALELPISSYSAWTDSTIVLSWIQSHASRWKTFVANRISTIQSSSLPLKWFHIRSEDNPADCASRGLSATDLSKFPLWWTGPQVLQHVSRPTKPLVDDKIKIHDLVKQEEKPITYHCHATAVNPDEFLNLYSDLSKTVRVVAWCQRFFHNANPKLDVRKGVLKITELQSAMNLLIQKTQLTAFSKEIQSLKKNDELPAKSKLRCLNPFLDEGILRVGGRLQHSSLPRNRKFPIVLPRHSRLTELVIRSRHLRYLHAGPSLTQAMIQREFWILRAKDAIRFQIKRCVKCAKVSAKPETQFMGDLPSSRVIPTPAFMRCGVDYAGPFNLKSGRGRKTTTEKAYLALFVCFVTRAFHLEPVSSLSTDAFLAALRRFVSRRGLPAHIHSDCGTNFVGADRELKKLVKSASHNQTIADSLSTDSITWHFNPAGAPHFGGLWEAGVKSVKFHLHRILTGYRLSFEELTTAFNQIEACLNSRPLTAMSSDPCDLEVLTSGHFLIGRPLLAAPEEDVVSVHQNRLSRWQLLQKINQQFWKRWSSEYLTRLQQRPKWLQHRDDIKLNDLVIIKDNLPAQKWKMGRVTQVHPGLDNIVRVVTLKTMDGTIKRPINKLCLLPILDNPAEELTLDIL